MKWKFWKKEEARSWFMTKRECYEVILYPIESVLLDLTSKEKIQAGYDFIMSPLYKQALFELNLVGSDELVKMHRNFLEKGTEAVGKLTFLDYLNFYKKVVLEMRKDLGEVDSKLTEDDLLFFQDLETAARAIGK